MKLLPCNASKGEVVVELRCVYVVVVGWGYVLVQICCAGFLVWCYGLLQVSFVCCRAACWCSRLSMIFCKLVLALFLLPEANCPAIQGGWGVLCFISPLFLPIAVLYFVISSKAHFLCFGLSLINKKIGN